MADKVQTKAEDARDSWIQEMHNDFIEMKYKN